MVPINGVWIPTECTHQKSPCLATPEQSCSFLLGTSTSRTWFSRRQVASKFKERENRLVVPNRSSGQCVANTFRFHDAKLHSISAHKPYHRLWSAFPCRETRIILCDESDTPLSCELVHLSDRISEPSVQKRELYILVNFQMRNPHQLVNMLVLGTENKILLAFYFLEECIGRFVRGAVRMMETSDWRQHRTERKGLPCRGSWVPGDSSVRRAYQPDVSILTGKINGKTYDFLKAFPMSRQSSPEELRERVQRCNHLASKDTEIQRNGLCGASHSPRVWPMFSIKQDRESCQKRKARLSSSPFRPNRRQGWILAEYGVWWILSLQAALVRLALPLIAAIHDRIGSDGCTVRFFTCTIIL